MVENCWSVGLQKAFVALLNTCWGYSLLLEGDCAIE